MKKNKIYIKIKIKMINMFLFFSFPQKVLNYPTNLNKVLKTLKYLIYILKLSY